MVKKIFETRFEKGSLIDAIENRLLTPTGTVTLKRTDKGTAALFDGGISSSVARLESDFQITTIPFTVVVNFKFVKSFSVGYIVSQTIINDPGRFIIDIQADNKLEYFLGGYSFKTNTLVNNKWYQAIFTRDGDGVCRFYLNNEYLGTYTNNTAIPLDNLFQIGGSLAVSGRVMFGYINKVIVYDGAISTVQREKHYQEFLQSQITEKPIRGFELVKPTDLSYLKDDKLGTNLTDNYDFNTWLSTGTAFVSKTANSFTTNNAGGGVSLSTLLTIGKKYRMTIRGTTTSGFTVTNLSVSPTYATFGVGDFNSTIDFTATTATSLYLRNTADGTTTITHLSFQEVTGLLAAYNFKRNGNTLVDISGNGYNFTISSGVVTQDNGLLFPLTNATITPSMQFPAGSKTVCWRGIVHSIPGTFARIYSSSYMMFNSNMSVLYYRAQSDTIVTINTGLSAPNFGKEFDLVFVQEGNNSQKLYINGVLVGTSTTETTSGQLISEIGSTGTTAGNILFKDLRFYTRAFTEAEVKAYHNSWVKPAILEDWSGSAVGDTI